MRPSQIIVLASPVFFALIALELGIGLWRERKGTGHNSYRWDDALSSIGLGMLSQASAVFTRLLRVGIYTAAWAGLSLVPQDAAQLFWTQWYGWLLALVFYDLCYYWLHRLGHESAILWAAHVVHHQSQDYNLSTALRQTSSGALLGWVFYLPMALAGVPPVVFGTVALIDLLYQFWVHTEQIGTLGWFDRWFCSPSNHRVHHAVNDAYLDKNYGGILVLWDRMFGSFQPEDPGNPCRYGTRKPLNSWDPLWANAEVYGALLKDSWATRRWGDKLRVWWKPPGWRPPDLAAHAPPPATSGPIPRPFGPDPGSAARWFGVLHFLGLLLGATVFLWHADQMPGPVAFVWLAVLVAGLWALGGVLQGRLGVLQALMLQAAALAMATAATDLELLHRLFKPLTLLIALVWVAVAQRQAAKAPDKVLLMALAASLAGDCFLMFPGYFIAGLLSFLVAHLFYIARLKAGVPWLPSHWATACTLLYGTAMFTVLWLGGLPASLRLPVAAYVVCIALMAAQAIGRARVMRDRASALVGLGAALFVLSDSLLAFNRFVSPLQLGGLHASFWVLSSYYAAQLLMVRGCLDAPTKR
ncbi:MAG: hypothetical protein RLZZ401_223 [Pseudomonadota bacterium]